MPAATEDTSFLEKYKAQPEAEDTSFLEKYLAKPATATMRPAPTMGAEATEIGPRKTGIYAAGTGAGPIESRVEDFLNPTTMYKKEHPILGGIGEGLRNLRETFTPGVMAAAMLLGAPEGKGGPVAPKRASVPAMSLPESTFPRVSAEPRPAAGMPRTVFEEPRQLGPVPQSERGQPPPSMRSPAPEAMRTEEKPAIQIEPMQKKPLGERRLGQAGRKPTVDEIVNQATGVKPLERNVPLREQMTSAQQRPIKLHDLGKEHDIPSDEGYLYHATNHERANEIATSGLDIHKPSYGTDQNMWPDGTTEKRSYFTKDADKAWQFSPEEGKGALVRMKQDPQIHKRESTGDFYSKTKIPAKNLEVLGEDKQWHPITELSSKRTVVMQTDPIKMKYPDPEIRQMVRVNGERMYEAAKSDPATLKAIHDMTRVDLRQALINSGEDMGQMTVSGSKFAGPGSIDRKEAFNRLLDKGLKPNDIVRMGKAQQQK